MISLNYAILCTCLYHLLYVHVMFLCLVIGGTNGGHTGQSESQELEKSHCGPIGEQLNQRRHSLQLVKFSCKMYRDKYIF